MWCGGGGGGDTEEWENEREREREKYENDGKSFRLARWQSERWDGCEKNSIAQARAWREREKRK